jgi:hypothetical protein
MDCPSLGHFPPRSHDGERGCCAGGRGDDATGLKNLPDELWAGVGLIWYDDLRGQDAVAGRNGSRRRNQVHRDGDIRRRRVCHREFIDDALAVRRLILRCRSSLSLLGRDDVFDGYSHCQEMLLVTVRIADGIPGTGGAAAKVWIVMSVVSTAHMSSK